MTRTPDLAVLRAWLDDRQTDVEHDHDRPGITPRSCYCDMPLPCEDRAAQMAAIDGMRAALAELEQRRMQCPGRGFLAQAYTNGWHDAIAAYQTPGWVQREAGWKKYLAEVDAFLVSKQSDTKPQQTKPNGDAR